MADYSKLTQDSSCFEVIKARKSVRSFNDQDISDDKIEELIEYTNSLTGPFGSKELDGTFRWGFLDNVEHCSRSTIFAISGTKYFFAGAVSGKAERDMEAFGYCFEQVVLKATQMGLGTCWMAGTFLNSVFSEAFKDPPFDKGKENICAVSPFGHFDSDASRHMVERFIRWLVTSTDRKPISELFFYDDFGSPLKGAGNCISTISRHFDSVSPTFVDKLFRYFAGSDSRKPTHELFFYDDYGTPLDNAGKDIEPYLDALEMVRIGPSASNKQGWRIVAKKDGSKMVFHLYSQGIGMFYKRLDSGIAMLHLEVSLNENNIFGKWDVLDEPDLPHKPNDVRYVCTFTPN